MNRLSQEVDDCHDNNCFCSTNDRFMENYRNKILKENNYILCSNFDLNKNVFSLECGLSVQRNFEPVVRLINKLDNKKISFNIAEWYFFVDRLKMMVNEFFENKTEEDPIIFVDIPNSSEQIHIQTSKFMDQKVIKIASTCQIPSTVLYLSEASVKQILKISGLLIKHRLEMLDNLRFASFYNNFLNTVNKLLIQSNYELSNENIISAVSGCLADNTQSYCLHECLFYHRNKMLEDLENNYM